MPENDETSVLCNLATEFANVARLYVRAADRADETEQVGLRRSSDHRQAIADRIVADFAPQALPAEGSWLPSTEEVEFRVKALVHQGWAMGALQDADQQLLARIRDLLLYGKPSHRAEHVIHVARDALRAQVQPTIATRIDEQPG